MLNLIAPVGVTGYEQNLFDFPAGRNAGLLIYKNDKINSFGYDVCWGEFVASATRLSRRTKPLTASFACIVAIPPG